MLKSKTSPKFSQPRNQGFRQPLEDGPPYKGDILLGVQLSSEVFSTDTRQVVTLGAVIVETEDAPAAQLRRCLRGQIPSLPPQFCFLTKQGWPVSTDQESHVRISSLVGLTRTIQIRRKFDKPRIGVRRQEGSALGFVFAEHNWLVSQLRRCIDEQIVSNNIGNIDSTQVYHFVDRNGWPLSVEQEQHLSTLDILDGSAVCVQENYLSSLLSPSGTSSNCSHGYELQELEHKGENRKCSPENLPNNKTRKLERDPTFRSSKDAARYTSSDSQIDQDSGKDILISYVRAESAHHAVNLKEELSLLGFSVYLDVDEIKTGEDWQDALNYAVSNCEVLVPLVTPHYGETQWTNREVKLADVLGKYIIPVSYVTSWPPRCLAIQFATTQFVPWKTAEEISDAKKRKEVSAEDIRHWSKEYVKRVAKKIGELCQNEGTLGNGSMKAKTAQNTKNNLKRHSMLRSYAAFLPDDVDAPSEVMEARQGKPLIVIGLHPAQILFARSLKFYLEQQSLEVWLSVEQAPPSPGMPYTKMSRSVSADYKGQPHPMLKITPSCTAVPEDFQMKADEAGVVLFLLSDAFAKSKTSKTQVFYCEHRKHVIPIAIEDFDMPGWMTMLIGRKKIEDSRKEGYRDSLLTRIRKALDPTARISEQNEIREAKIAFHARFLRQAMNIENCVYVFGGVKLKRKRSEEICRLLGYHLAGIDQLSVVTGGLFGAADLVARSFVDAKKRLHKLPDVWHVLPEKDSSDCRDKSRQDADGTFQIVPFGHTVFRGESLEERESIVARVFEIAVLIEGEADLSHECVEFLWNDHLVIPIKSTGGIAGGSFGIPQKIFEVPAGVNEQDWHVLSDLNAKVEDVAKAVVQIVLSLRTTLRTDFDAEVVVPRPKLRNKSVRNRISQARLASMKTVMITEDGTTL